MYSLCISTKSGVCFCTHFPFHLLSVSRPFHHLFSLFLIQHMSVLHLLRHFAPPVLACLSMCSGAAIIQQKLQLFIYSSFFSFSLFKHVIYSCQELTFPLWGTSFLSSKINKTLGFSPRLNLCQQKSSFHPFTKIRLAYMPLWRDEFVQKKIWGGMWINKNADFIYNSFYYMKWNKWKKKPRVTSPLILIKGILNMFVYIINNMGGKSLLWICYLY